jgi:hypothetical protein
MRAKRRYAIRRGRASAGERLRLPRGWRALGLQDWLRRTRVNHRRAQRIGLLPPLRGGLRCIGLLPPLRGGLRCIGLLPPCGAGLRWGVEEFSSIPHRSRTKGGPGRKRGCRLAFLSALSLLFFTPSWVQGGELQEGQGQLDSKTKTRNILLVTSDGLRWQEVFGGADPTLVNPANIAQSQLDTVTKEFLLDKPLDRRKALMPFMWSVIASQGQIFGNVHAGSEAKVTNGKNFSYPGYNEIFTGRADPAINSNDKFPNPNVSVLEWLNRQDAFRGRVAAYGGWDVYPYILNQDRSGIKVVAGWAPANASGLSEREQLINTLMHETPAMWEGCCYDSFIFHAALEHLKRRAPRVLYIGLGETDEFAHEGRYDQYLLSAQRADQYLKTLWDTVQSLPEYRGTTTMIVTTDHGRGGAPVEWKSHGEEVKGSERIWIAVIGPDTPALGERKNVALVTQSQIAATLAALLGSDYRAFAPKAGLPIGSVLPASENSHAAQPRRNGQ